MAVTPLKIPVSVLVVVYTADLQVLLIERADATGAATGLWQSVTGSLDFDGEPLFDACWREVREETGIDCTQLGCVLRNWHQRNEYTISALWRSRYAPGVLHNTEHVFGLHIPAACTVTLNPVEHVACQWLPWQAAAQRCFSPTNAKAIRQLPQLGHALLSKSKA